MKDISKNNNLGIIVESESKSTTKIDTYRKYGICKNTLVYWKKAILEDTPEERENVREEAK